MALNIGNVNFGVDANTAGLQKAIAQLASFQKATNRVARSQSEGAQKTATAMSRQESAIKKAFQATLQLRQAQQRAGAPAEEIARVSNAFQKLTKDLTSGKLSMIDFTRAVDGFNAKMGRSKRALTEFSQAAKSGNISKLGNTLRQLESASVLAIGPLSGLGARIRSLGAIFGRANLKAVAFFGGLAAGAVALGFLGKAAVSAGQEMKSLILRFEAATGSSVLARQELSFVINVARKLGLQIGALSSSYARFLASSQGTSIEGEKSRVIFLQVAKAAAALKLSADDTLGVMRAFEQIMSKGTVQAEELRGQLGDRLPGAFRIAAKAMGVTTQELNKMLKAGEVISDEFLPKFARQLEQDLGSNAAKNLSTMSGQVNLLGTEFKILAADVDDFTSASAALTSMIGLVTGAVRGMRSGVRAAGEFFGIMDEALDKVTRTVREATEPIRKLGKVFVDMKEDADEAEAELKIMEEAIGFLGKAGDDIEFLVDFFTSLAKAEKLSNDEVAEMAEHFSTLLGLDIEATFEGIAAAMAESALQAREVQERIDNITGTPEALEDIEADFKTLAMQIEALKKGPLGEALFKNVTEGVIAFEEATKDLVITEAAREKLIIRMRALLTEIDILERANIDTKKAARKEEQQAISAMKKANKQIERSIEQIGVLRARVRALAEGPDSFEVFTKVTEKVLKYRQALERAGNAQAVVNALTGEYRRLLEEQLLLTDRFARAGEQAAAAIVNGLEDIILKGESVKKMLHELAKELLRVALRALFLDQLQAGLSSFFGNTFRTGGGVGGGGGGGGGTGKPRAARGLSFRVGGSGGSDSVPVGFFAKPGEIVTVQRPDQMAGGAGHGGSGVTINQTNNFEGGISDPAILIPILEENNRKLKGEILDGLDRGSFI